MLKDPIFVFNAPNWFQVIIVFIEWHYSEKRTTQPINPILQFGCLLAVTLSHKCRSILLQIHEFTWENFKESQLVILWSSTFYFDFRLLLTKYWPIDFKMHFFPLMRLHSLFSFFLHRSLTFIRTEEKKHSVYHFISACVVRRVRICCILSDS